MIAKEGLPGLQWPILPSLIVIVFGVSAYAEEVFGIPRIVDGDTVEINGVKIRLEGIDALETDQLCLSGNAEYGRAVLKPAISFREHAELGSRSSCARSAVS